MKNIFLILYYIFIVSCSTESISPRDNNTHAILLPTLISSDEDQEIIIIPTLTAIEKQGLKKALEQVRSVDTSTMKKYMSKIQSGQETIVRELYISSENTSFILLSVTVKNNMIKESVRYSGRLHKYNSNKFLIQDNQENNLTLKNDYDKVYNLAVNQYYKFNRHDDSWKNIPTGTKIYYLVNDKNPNKYIKTLDITYEDESADGKLIFDLYPSNIDDTNPTFKKFIRVN